MLRYILVCYISIIQFTKLQEQVCPNIFGAIMNTFDNSVSHSAKAERNILINLDFQSISRKMYIYTHSAL